MSTKAIREALAFWAENCPDAPAGIKAKAGLVELEAIEKAARAWHEDDMGNWVPVGELNDMANLLRAIAKQER